MQTDKPGALAKLAYETFTKASEAGSAFAPPAIQFEDLHPQLKSAWILTVHAVEERLAKK